MSFKYYKKNFPIINLGTVVHGLFPVFGVELNCIKNYNISSVFLDIMDLTGMPCMIAYAIFTGSLIRK